MISLINHDSRLRSQWGRDQIYPDGNHHIIINYIIQYINHIIHFNRIFHCKPSILIIRIPHKPKLTKWKTSTSLSRGPPVWASKMERSKTKPWLLREHPAYSVEECTVKYFGHLQVPNTNNWKWGWIICIYYIYLGHPQDTFSCPDEKK